MSQKLVIKGARVHNLKNISLTIPKNQLVVITGLSGSGKSSLAFDTIYAEGQRRFMESLSAYARQFLELQDKPDVDHIDGLSPTIAIDQRSAATNPRSTVGTITEIYDYLRVLFARAGVPHCPECGKQLVSQTPRMISETAAGLIKHGGLTILAPIVRDEKGEHRHAISGVKAAGFREIRYDGTIIEIDEAAVMPKDKAKRHTIDVVIGRVGQDEVGAEDLIEDFVKKAIELGNGVLKILVGDKEQVFSTQLSCPDCRISMSPPEPRMFSFNSPHGACSACTGLGLKLDFEPELVIPNRRLTLAQGAVKPLTRIAGNQTSILRALESVGRSAGFSINVPLEKYTRKQLDIVFYGGGEFPGIIPILEEKYRTTDSDYVRGELENYMRPKLCAACGGKRLKKEVLAVTVRDKSISDLVSMPIDELDKFFESQLGRIKNNSGAEEKVIMLVAGEVAVRLKNLIDVGLAYLTLDRSAVTLSGGEAQRVRLASQLGATLTGVIYILDEPSIGLHQRDASKLIDTLKKLRNLENTVIVVEHDEQIMRSADWLIDIGPGAGIYGGEVVAEGKPKDVERSGSLTGLYLAGKKKIVPPRHTRKGSGKVLTVKGATAYNLRGIDVRFPLGKFVCVTGLSGSGKSSLVLDILARALAHELYRAKDLPAEHKKIIGLENIDKVVTVDQAPIGRTPRSNPATYTGVFTAIRDLYTDIPEAKMRGFDAGKFSFNVKGGGRCEACAGEGYVSLAMQFLPDVYVECRECGGKRYNREALEVRYKSRDIADVLNMTVEEANDFFSDVPAIHDKLSVLSEVGLGYIKLGQPAPTLSGGEAQRVKLATELSRRATGRTLYILDEPTTGLHFDDVGKLLAVLHQLVDKGNTVLVIEHHLDVVKSADWIIELGPEGGVRGGELVAEGAPAEIAKTKNSPTGFYLKRFLSSGKSGKTAKKIREAV